MKSIEELLEIIKGVDMDLWDNVEQEAYDEILSAFAELEAAKVGSITVDLKGTDIQKDIIKKQGERIAELEAQVERMKCCGNCNYKYSINNNNPDGCDEVRFNSDKTVCDKWEAK